MAYRITNNSSITSQRVLPLWCVGSNGTTPATGEAAGQPTWMLGGVYYGNTANTLSAWSANAGEYYITLSKSETSVVGQGVVRYNSATALETATPFEVVAADSYDSVRFGLTALPNVAAAAAGGLITSGTGAGQLNVSAGSVGLLAATHSGVTIQGVTLLNSNVTITNALYSAVTVRLDLQTYSGATVGVNNIAAGLYSGVSVGVVNSNVTAGQAIADRVLLRNLAGGNDSGRSVGDALRSLRNRVDIGASIGTVYAEDDISSAWTFSITTTASQVFLTGINPAGGSA